MTRLFSHISLLLIALFSPWCLASAAETDKEVQHSSHDASSWQLALAVGWGHKSNPVIEREDIPVYVIPSIAWYGDQLFFDNGTLGYTLAASDNLSLSLIGSFSNDAGWFNRWDPSNLFINGFSGGGSAGVSAMGISSFSRATPPRYDLDDRDQTYMGGGELLWFSPIGNWRLVLVQDMFNVHQGGMAQLAWSHHWRWHQLTLDLALQMDWKSHELVDYYYGIRPWEALGGSPTYQGESSINTGVELDISYPITNMLELLLLGRYTRFGAGIAHSPLIKEDNSFGVFIGAAYRF